MLDTPTNVAGKSADSNRETLAAEVRRLNLTLGWELRAAAGDSTAQAPSKFIPAHWSYEACKMLLNSAGRSIDVSLAERRNLLLRNPIEGNSFWTASTLLAAYQMILPGEFAPVHRHTPSALRVIIEGAGTYSVVNGEKMPMETGDVLLTPGGSWHSHGHDGDEPAYWLDGLDSPLVRLLEVMSFEVPAERHDAAMRVLATSPLRFAADDIRRGLDTAKPDPEGVRGAAIKLHAPDMPTLELLVQRLPAGASTRSGRSTANRVYSVMEGNGTSIVGDQRFTWCRGDTFVVPSWVKMQHRAATDVVLFELSDETLKRFCRFYRCELD